ncbi:MAG: hypothetical protein NBKEAIPA_03125 [Nitrospirae bacterium]|nr:hypothetical protein [Nitrospirota bacterium]
MGSAKKTPIDTSSYLQIVSVSYAAIPAEFSASLMLPLRHFGAAQHLLSAANRATPLPLLTKELGYLLLIPHHQGGGTIPVFP